MASTGRLSLRTRIVGSAIVVVGVALAIGAVLFVMLYRGTLLDSLQATAEGQASAIADRLDSSGAATLDDNELDDDDRLLQLVSADGDVLAAAEDSPASALLTEETENAVSVEHDGEGYLAVAVDADTGLVVVALSRDDVDESLATVVPLVVAAVPTLLLLVATTIWVVVGRALRPVEMMRRSVEAVTASSLDQRIPSPAGGDEIARLAATMNGMLERLDRSQKAQRRFVSDASHELKSPLASLRQYAEVATSYPDRLGAEELADAIREEGGRLEAIVRGMLVLARADEGALAGGGDEVDLDDVLLAEASRLRSSSGLLVDSSGVGPGRVVGSGELLAQVVRNLVDNAAAHAAERVALSLEEAAGIVTLAVDDDGPGITEADRERVFERFVRLDDARARATGGSGLGLAIVRELVAAHGGVASVGTSPLGGARVAISLPAAS